MAGSAKARVVVGGDDNGRNGTATATATSTRARRRGSWRENSARGGWKTQTTTLTRLVGTAVLIRAIWNEYELFSVAPAGNANFDYVALGTWLLRPSANASSLPSSAKNGASKVPDYLPNKATRWADTPAGDVCNNLLPWGAYPRDSFNAIWDALRPTILNESYHPFQDYHPENATAREQLQEFRHWTSTLFYDFYTYERLRRSQVHPAPIASVRRILQLVRDRLHDPDKHEPIRIAVMGGSVAVGRGSQLSPYSITRTSGRCTGECNYVSRIRHLLNTVIFATNHSNRAFPVFEVLNLAAGGTNSEVGAMAMRYDLIPQIQHKPPHIVVSSYSANDAKDPDLRKTFHEDQQAFVRAAHELRPCDDDLPLIVLADDYYGGIYVAENALEQTGSIYKTASYHNVMATAFSNVVRHWYMMENPVSLFGSFFTPHLGMGLHYGQSWALLFNFLGAIHDACSEGVGPEERKVTRVGERGSNRTRWQLKELPTKYRGRYQSDLRSVQREWKENVEAKELRCHQLQNRSNEGESAASSATRSSSRYRTRVCEYAWMANKATPFNDPAAVRNAMNDILVSNQGWTVSGEETPGELETNARTGWVTNSSKASFAIEIKDLRQPVTSLTVLSMKSYGPDWVDSKLRVTVEVVTREGLSLPSDSMEIEGFYEIQTSVNFPHQLVFNDGWAKVGDTIRAKFELFQGQKFKISGIALCQLADQ